MYLLLFQYVYSADFDCKLNLQIDCIFVFDYLFDTKLIIISLHIYTFPYTTYILFDI